MIPLTDEEEKALDKGHLHCIKGNQTFDITANNIICYGEIDFSDCSDDMYTIADMNWLSHLVEHGVDVPSQYNYEEHCCWTPNKMYRTYDTTNPAVVAQYIHGMLGKPKSCCIFKEIINVKRRV